MNKFSCCILFILLISTSHLLAQHADCNTALEICENAPMYIVPGGGIGSTDSDIGNSCVMQEYNPMWIKWTIMESGIITFLIIPDSMEQDIDFVVFHAASDYDCNNKIQIRCMAAGANSGQPPHEWVQCSGATGLSVDETDVEEPAGCQANNNNYLAPIQALAGDQYIMLINDFANSGYGYTLTFTGTAVLDCNTVSIIPDKATSKEFLMVYPTVSTGTISINLPGTELKDSRLKIYTMQGQLVHTNEQLIGTPIQVDLHHLSEGAYFAVLQNSHSTQAQNFLLLK